jgi:hypothetical protein
VIRRRLPADIVAGLGAALAIALGASVVPSPAVPSAAAALAAIANPDTLSTSHDRIAFVPAPGVLKNDANLLGSTTAILVSGTTHGSVGLDADGGYTYDPDPAYVGTDVFKYRDSGLVTNTTTVTITVVNAAPVASDDAYTATTGVTMTVEAPGVLGNDADADGDAMTASLIDGGGNGTVRLSSNGRLVFTSGGSFTGPRTLTYRVSDGLAWSANATVTIDVRPPLATATPTPAPTPTPTPTPIVLPSALPTALPTLPPILPSARPSLLPAPTPTPTPGSGSGDPGSPRPSEEASARPSAALVGGGSSSTGSGGEGGGTDRDPSPGGGRAVKQGTFTIGRDETVDVDGLGDVGVTWSAVIDWAVPAVTLTVPGLLLMLAVLAQMLGGLVWLPVARRWLGTFGLRLRRSKAPEAA